MIAFVAASPSIDRTHVVDALTPGEIHRPEHVVAVPGGKALNAARASGMELATPAGDILRAVPPRIGAYPVGSGDAALGGFLTALDAGAGWEDALARATTAAAANAQVPGGGRLGPRP